MDVIDLGSVHQRVGYADFYYQEMAAKSKFGGGMGDAVADNQNWANCIRTEKTAATQWAQNWGFLAQGSEIKGTGPEEIQKQIQAKEAEVAELRERVLARAKGGRWQQASNTIGNAKWSEDTVISNAIWKQNSLANDPWIRPTNPF